jgi:lia operon protein LiaG
MSISPSRQPAGAPRRLCLGSASALTLLAMGVLTSSAVPARTAGAQDRRTVQFETRDIAVYNFVGTLRVTGSSDSRAEAAVTMLGRDRARLDVSVSDVRGRETLRVRYPEGAIRSPDAMRGRTTSWVRTDGTWGDRNGSRGRRVEITNSANALDASADIELRVPRGVTTRVYLLAGRVDVRNVDGELHVDVAAANVSASGGRGPLWLDTGSGDVDVRDTEGDLHLDTGSGDVTVRNARGDVLDADTGSGDVTFDGISFESGRFDTGSGDVRVSDAELGRAEFDTGSGGVFGSFRTTPESLAMDSGSGDVTVELPRNAGTEVSISTSSGRITTDFPIAVTRQSRRSLRGTIGDGSASLKIDAGSGNVRLRTRS